MNNKTMTQGSPKGPATGDFRRLDTLMAPATGFLCFLLITQHKHETNRKLTLFQSTGGRMFLFLLYTLSVNSNFVFKL